MRVPKKSVAQVDGNKVFDHHLGEHTVFSILSFFFSSFNVEFVL